jgi:hypothetical protein
MTFFFTFYLLLTVLMIINKVYCLVHHRQDYFIKKFILRSKRANANTESMGLVHAKMVSEFYGGVWATVLVILVEFGWFIAGLLSFMWPYFLVLFAINVTVHRFEGQLLQNRTRFFVTKLAYLGLYSFYFFYFLDHYLNF